MNYLKALLLILLTASIDLQAQEEIRFHEEIEGIKLRIKDIDHSEPLILFVGSSSIRLWSSLEEDMEPLNVFNAGFGGSAIGDVNDNFDAIVLAAKPSEIVFYCGENDIADLGLSSQDVQENFGIFMSKMYKLLPNIPVYFLSIKPSPSRWQEWPEMVEANELISKMASKLTDLTYIDVSGPMIEENGEVRNDIFIEDNLHMNNQGYAIWSEIILKEIR